MLKQIDSAMLFGLYFRIIWICCMKLETHEFDRSCERLARRSSGDPTTRKSTPSRFRRVFHRNARRRRRRVYQAARAQRFPAREAVVRERKLGVWKRSRQWAQVWCAAEPKPSSGSCLTMVVLLKWGFVRCSVTPLTPAKPWECKSSLSLSLYIYLYLYLQQLYPNLKAIHIFLCQKYNFTKYLPIITSWLL